MYGIQYLVCPLGPWMHHVMLLDTTCPWAPLYEQYLADTQ
jgi:hypothetical protein